MLPPETLDRFTPAQIEKITKLNGKQLEERVEDVKFAKKSCRFLGLTARLTKVLSVPMGAIMIADGLATAEPFLSAVGAFFEIGALVMHAVEKDYSEAVKNWHEELYLLQQVADDRSRQNYEALLEPQSNQQQLIFNPEEN